MPGLDPQLQRLREVQARISFAECHLKDQEAMLDRLADKGHAAQLAHEAVASTQQALAELHRRQDDLMVALRGDAGGA
jgi:hypothetical protein